MDLVYLLTSNTPFYDIIATELSIIDAIYLRRACKKLYSLKLPLGNISKLLAKRLGFDPRPLFNNGCVLSGGFLLECLHGDNYGSDVDLLQHVDSYVYDTNPDTNSAPVRLYKWLGNYGYEIPPEGYVKHCYPSGFHARKLLSNGRYIDHIMVNKDISLKEFLTKYDLDFCKNYYDGERLYMYNFDSVASRACTIEESYIDHIQIREAVVNNNRSNQTNFIERIFKYESRGYKIIRPDDLISKIKNKYPNVELIVC